MPVPAHFLDACPGFAGFGPGLEECLSRYEGEEGFNMNKICQKKKIFAK